MQGRDIAQQFLQFVNKAVTPFHAVAQSRQQLKESNYTELLEHEHWDLSPGGKYFFTRNQSSIIAFIVGQNYTQSTGKFKIIGTHTDSPCPKLAPNSAKVTGKYNQLNVQLYGGGLWHSWFDRDLTLAGRVVFEQDGLIKSGLVHFDRPLLNIPQLAIHLSTKRENFDYSKETHVKPIISLAVNEQLNPGNTHFSGVLNLVADQLFIQADQITDLELCLVDSNPSGLSGLYEEFISSPRLDNLMSTYCALQALLNCPVPDQEIVLWAAFDNEEIGSNSIQGADCVLIEQALNRIINAIPGESIQDAFSINLRKSFIISADMAHALHPNYSEKHQSGHQPIIDQGVVIKTNANQRYATDGVGASMIRRLGRNNGIPLQEFVVRNDSPCGSTIGPILASKTGIRTVDIGAPQLAMHSCREFMGVQDAKHYYDLMLAFYADQEFFNAPAALLQFNQTIS